MSNSGRYYEVLGIVNFSESCITGKHEIYDSYFVDTKYGEVPLLENQIDKWDRRIKYEEEGVLSKVCDCADAEGIGLLTKLGTFYSDIFPDDADFFEVTDEEKDIMVNLFKDTVGLDVKPEHITKSTFCYWG